MQDAYVHKHRFTIVELLIVFVVVAILAAISIAAYTNIRSRAEDTKRAHDIASIKKAIMAYDQLHGGVPKTSTYGASMGSGGWDHSNRPEWLAFLRPEHGNMPVDLDGTYDGIDPGRSGNRVYFYFCYSATATEPNRVHLRYHRNSDQVVGSIFEVTSCL